MTRVYVFLVLIFGLPGMGNTPEPNLMPLACEVLETAGIPALIGEDTTLNQDILRESEDSNLSLCTIQPGDGSRGASLMLTERFDDAPPASVDARASYVTEIKTEIGDEAKAEDVAIGEAAVWIGAIGQLTIWIGGGSVMMIVSPGEGGLALAEQIANAIVAAYP